VAETVLHREDSRKRAAVVKHFISVADVSSIVIIHEDINQLHYDSAVEISKTSQQWWL
jgi:hypothetical protein